MSFPSTPHAYDPRCPCLVHPHIHALPKCFRCAISNQCQDKTAPAKARDARRKAFRSKPSNHPTSIVGTDSGCTYPLSPIPFPSFIWFELNVHNSRRGREDEKMARRCGWFETQTRLRRCDSETIRSHVWNENVVAGAPRTAGGSS